MPWGGFSALGRTPLAGTYGGFTSDTYRVIIDNHILPSMYDNHGGPGSFLLQEDNYGPHGAKRIASCLQNEEVSKMKGPALRPDLSPIENVWGPMKSRLRKHHVHPRNPTYLFSILNEIWNSLPDFFFKI